MKTFTALLTSLAFACVTAHAAADKPNVILFLVDDMGWMDCGVYGSKYYETPRMDAFAKTAMRFTSAYAQPLCSPTRASLLSGQYDSRHGITTASGHQPPQEPGHKFLPDTAPPTQDGLVVFDFAHIRGWKGGVVALDVRGGRVVSAAWNVGPETTD